MKKILSIILAIMMCVSLFPCGVLAVPEAAAAPEEPLTEPQPAADAAEEGSENTAEETFTMPADSVSTRELHTYDILSRLNGSGTEEDPWQLNSSNDWNVIADAIENGEETSGQYFVMTANVGTVSAMLGTESNPFAGHFDGGGNTLTVNYTAAEQFCAPFRYVDGAAFENLTVTGTINTSYVSAAGLVGNAANSCMITNCVSDVNIISNVSVANEHGGFVATATNTRIEGCVYTGSITGSNLRYCAGFINRGDSSCLCVNCIFAPDSFPSDNCANFCRWGNAGDNCYYFTALGSSRETGKQAYSVTSSENVTIDFGEPVAVYELSGVSACAPGVMYGGIFYAGEGETVDLTLTAAEPDHQRLTHWTGADGLTVSGGADGASAALVMPAENVVISAEFEDVFYVNLSVTPQNGGEVFGAGAYTPGYAVLIYARAWEGYRFDHWVNQSSGALIDSADCSFLINEDRSYQAVFVEDPSNVNSYTLELPSDMTVASDTQFSALTANISALQMEAYTAGHLPNRLRIAFTANDGGMLRKPYSNARTMQFGLNTSQSAGSLPVSAYLDFNNTGSKNVYIVIPQSNWDEAYPGTYYGSIGYTVAWQYDDGTWSDPVETGTIPVTVTVPGTPETWLVNFDLGFYNGYCEPPAEQYVVPGGTAEDPGEFKVNGPYSMVFTGWYTDRGCTNIYDFETPVTDDLTLYAGYRYLSEQEKEEWFNGFYFGYPPSEREYEMYRNTGNGIWRQGIHILYFDLIDGLDYDPVNHVLTFENYTGPVITLENVTDLYGSDPTDTITIEIKGVNNIYLGERRVQEIWRTNVIFTGDGTVNFDMLGFWSGRELELHGKSFGITYGFDVDNSIVWDGPTLNMFNMFNPLNRTQDYVDAYGEGGPLLTLLSGSVNFELTPVSFGNWHYGPVLLGKDFKLLGGSFHVHYTIDPYVFDMLSQDSNGITPCVSEGTYHVFEARWRSNGGRTEREPIISPDCDFQITVDPEVAAGGFSVIPFDLEDFDFTWFDPDLSPEDVGTNFHYPNAFGDPIADINEVEGLSYDYENYFDLGDHPHKLTMENYSGPGFFSVSTNYLNTSLEIELIGENTVYCSGFGGLGFDDINLIFTGSGSLRVINCSTGETIAYQSGDLFTPPRAYCLFGIFQMFDMPAGGYQENGHSYMTVDGPDIIIEGGYDYGAVAWFDRVTVRSGSLVTDARQCSTSIVYNNSNIPGYFCQFYFDNDSDPYNPTDVPNVVVEGGTLVVNYEESPRGYDTFYVIQSPLVPGVRYIYTLGGIEYEPDTLIVVGEQRVLDQDFYAGTYDVDDGGGWDHNKFEGHMRFVQTADAENGYAVPRLEGGMVYVTVHPDEGMSLISLSYVGANSDPIQIPKTGDEYVFPLPEGNNDVLITAVFGDAPAITHTVTFLDWDGTVLWQQEVFDREAALPLGEPEREGYVFIGWDTDFSNVTEDLIVTATYRLPGDVNLSGRIDATDALLVMRYAMGIIVLDEQATALADVNGDGFVNSSDAILIMRMLLI